MSNARKKDCGTCLSRRGLLKTGMTGAALSVLPLGCVGQAPVPDGPIAAGNVATTSVGSLRVVNGNAVLGRDANGLYAMSNVCTHEGCTMEVGGAGGAAELVCNCHGSIFDANGGVTRGPARAALAHYKVDLASDGSITIQGGQTVASTARTPVG